MRLLSLFLLLRRSPAEVIAVTEVIGYQRSNPCKWRRLDNLARSPGERRFFEVYPDLLEVLWAKRVVVYNASYDRRVWDAAVGRLGARAALAGELASWECAMRAFAAYVGERSKRGGYKNQKLVGADHTAIGDARATLRLIERMAEGALSDQESTK
jgi:DNA polymerase III epsilon subunit-like protein